MAKPAARFRRRLPALLETSSRSWSARWKRSGPVELHEVRDNLHTRHKRPLAESTSLSDICPNLVEFAPNLPVVGPTLATSGKGSGQFWSNAAEFRPNFVEVGRMRPFSGATLVKFGRFRSGFGRCQANAGVSGQFRSFPDQLRPIPSKRWTSLISCGQICVDPGPNLAEHGSRSADFGPDLAESWLNLPSAPAIGRIWPEINQIRQMSNPFLPKSFRIHKCLNSA